MARFGPSTAALPQERPANAADRDKRRTSGSGRQAGGHWFEPSTAHLGKPRSRGVFRFPIGVRVRTLAHVPGALVRGGCTILAPGLALVLRVNFVEVRDVLGCRIVARVHAQDGIESLLGSPPTLGHLVHMDYLPGAGADQSLRAERCRKPATFV